MLKEFMLQFFDDPTVDVDLVCGMAKGADLLGQQWAKEVGVPWKEFPAEWDLYGRSAGYRRNVEMAEYADILIAFWDGDSKGTKHMIECMKKLKKEVHIVYQKRN